ncbi:MAG: type I methionyl aminopeptidase [bacterium]
MIIIKTEKEIAIMRAGGRKLAKILREIVRQVRPGAMTGDLENLANELITKEGGQPSFKGYKNSSAADPYDSALCVSLNNEVVHRSPWPSRAIKAGDLVSIDIGLEYQGYHTDMAISVGVGKVSSEVKKLLKITKQALDKAIKEIKPGKTLGDIGYAVQSLVEKNGFNVVRQLAGHGVGRKIHEDPPVLNYGQPGKGLELKEGMTLAIEPMVNVGRAEVISLEDGWTIATADNSLSAHFEHTVAITEKGCEALTK